MKTTKRVLVTFLVTFMLTISFGGIAFASELDQIGTIPIQGAVTEEDNIVTNIEAINNLEALEVTLDAVNTEDTVENENSEADTDGQDIANAQENFSSDNKDDEIQVNEDGSYVDEQGQLYIIDYVDEQGQVYYKKAEEVTTEDTAESTKEEEEKVEEEEEPVEKKPSYSEKDLRLLASLVYAEAGNQSYKGMLGVANVVLNRAKSDAYWHVDTIKEVIYDRKWSVQFAVTVKSKRTGESLLGKALKSYDTGKFSGGNPGAEKKAMQQAIKAAKAALQGENNIGDYLCFQNKRSASRIKKKYSDYKIIGDHIFYRTK